LKLLVRDYKVCFVSLDDQEREGLIKYGMIQQIAKDALTILINLSTDREILQNLASDKEFMQTLLGRVTVCLFPPTSPPLLFSHLNLQTHEPRNRIPKKQTQTKSRCSSPTSPNTTS
jgi:hypothetical protein